MPTPRKVLVGAAMSTDKNYNTLDGADVALTNVDDDSPGVIVKPNSGKTGEAPAAAAFTFSVVVVATKPLPTAATPSQTSTASAGVDCEGRLAGGQARSLG